MAKFRIDSIADLARQMRFTPSRTLLRQLAAAEDLLHSIDPTKAYPWDFVVFRITGYRPKNAGDELLTGMALQHDLGLLIETLSQSLDLCTTDVAEPVLSIDDVAERFNVTSKTIQRWRRRGLPARKFRYPDGKRRVSFLLSSVERFFAAHRDQAPACLNYQPPDQHEYEQILRRARMLARECGCWEGEIARRIGRRLGRSPLTILHLIRKHDQEHPKEAILHWAPIPIPQEDRSCIVQAYRQGASISSLARKYHQSRWAIYRVIMDQRIERLSNRKVTFIDDPLYHQPDAAAALDAIASQEELGPTAGLEQQRIPRDLPPYLQDLYRTPLLTPARERALFLKYNFLKRQFVLARRKLEPQFAKARDLDRLEALLARATEVKNVIVQANLRLVVSVARKHLRPGLNLMDLVSDGNLTLMRAVESFDVHKGHRFSTYATLALMKGFARSVPKMLSAAACSSASDQILGQLPDHRSQPPDQQLIRQDNVRQLLFGLNDRERSVLCLRYGLDNLDQTPTSDQLD